MTPKLLIILKGDVSKWLTMFLGKRDDHLTKKTTVLCEAPSSRTKSYDPGCQSSLQNMNAPKI